MPGKSDPSGPRFVFRQKEASIITTSRKCSEHHETDADGITWTTLTVESTHALCSALAQLSILNQELVQIICLGHNMEPVFVIISKTKPLIAKR